MALAGGDYAIVSYASVLIGLSEPQNIVMATDISVRYNNVVVLLIGYLS